MLFKYTKYINIYHNCYQNVGRRSKLFVFKVFFTIFFYVQNWVVFDYNKIKHNFRLKMIIKFKILTLIYEIYNAEI